MISIIIPTLNESENIVSTIKEIKKYLGKIKHEILVVDDSSTDGTAFVINKAKIKNVFCIERKEKRSLSGSVVLGFQKAKYENLLVMDADGQHDPRIIPLMLDNIKNADFVSGSRFVKGGSVEGWSKKRIFISKFAAFLSKPLIPKKSKDPMSGFFMTKKYIFSKVKNLISQKGYKIYLDMVLSYKKINKNIEIKEIPYKFRVRKKGKSKLKFKTIIDYLFMILKYYFYYYSEFLKFLLVGLIGVIVNTVILFSLTEFFKIYYLISGIFATIFAILNNFLLNNFWTWKNRNNKYSFNKRLGVFFLVSFIGLIISLSTLWFFTELGVYYIISNFIGIIFGTFWNYFANKNITFKEN